MIYRATLTAGLFLGLIASSSALQAQSVVQLPSIRIFNVDSTVVVPDRGKAFLGGVSRGADGQVSRGTPILGNLPYAGRLFRNRAIGSTRSHSTSHVTATIIILSEMEDEVMAEAARNQEIRSAARARSNSAVAEPPQSDVQQRAAFLSRHIGRSKKQKQ